MEIRVEKIFAEESQKQGKLIIYVNFIHTVFVLKIIIAEKALHTLRKRRCGEGQCIMVAHAVYVEVSAYLRAAPKAPLGLSLIHV